MADPDKAPPGLSIGAVSQATGIPANTLRTWERRYGFPEPQRTAGGQRLYDTSVVEHLRLANLALELGHRPGQALAASLDELKAWVHTSQPGQAANTSDDWIRHTEDLDDQALDAGIRQRWTQQGAMPFLTQTLIPFLEEVGDRWADGRLEVFHEHFASARVGAFLAARWQELGRPNEISRGVVAALPGEQHELCLHIVATVLALHGWQPVFLGAESPITEISGCARHIGARCVFLSTTTAGLEHPYHALRALLPRSTGLVTGGRSAPQDVEGAVYLPSMEALGRWATTRT